MDGLVKKILRGDFTPLPSWVTPEVASLVKSLLSQNMKARPSVGDVLQLPCMMRRMKVFLDKQLTTMIGKSVRLSHPP